MLQIKYIKFLLLMRASRVVKKKSMYGLHMSCKHNICKPNFRLPNRKPTTITNLSTPVGVYVCECLYGLFTRKFTSLRVFVGFFTGTCMPVRCQRFYTTQ